MSKSQFNVDLVDMTDISDTSVERRNAELCAQFSWKGHPGTIVIVMEGWSKFSCFETQLYLMKYIFPVENSYLDFQRNLLQASVKNFQIVHESDTDYIIMQVSMLWMMMIVIKIQIFICFMLMVLLMIMMTMMMNLQMT